MSTSTNDTSQSTQAAGRCGEPDHALYREVLAERARAHAKHGANSIEVEPGTSSRWLAILAEEVGEVSEEIFSLALNVALGKVAHASTYDQDPAHRRTELIQVMAVASAWIAAIDRAVQDDTTPTPAAATPPAAEPAPRVARPFREATGERSVRFAARFDSTCAGCGDLIAAGADVAWSDGDVVHDLCAMDAGVEVFER